MSVGIHFFRKDLRVNDNLALNELAKRVDTIIGLFVFDQSQIYKRASNSAYHSQHAALFVMDAVDDLKRQCDDKLVVQYGKPSKVLTDLIKQTKAAVVSMNADFTPYALDRDEDLRRVCNDAGVELIVNEDDQCIAPMQSLTKADGSPYMVFGSFFKNLQKQEISKPTTKRVEWLKPRGIKNYEPTRPSKTIQNLWTGGRKHATSNLSAFMNHGCVSIREVYAKYDLDRSVAWRDFFLCIYRFHPNGNAYDKHIDPRYDMIKWPRAKESEWTRFIDCDTGFLLVDAAMAELLATGFTDNRSRLVLATFWIKYLLINPLDPEYGSQVWFSRLLVDCSASQNKLNHQWVIGDLDLSGRRFAMKGNHPLTGRSMRIDNDTIRNYDHIQKWIPRFADKSKKECRELMKQTTPMYEWRSRYSQYNRLFEKIPHG